MAVEKEGFASRWSRRKQEVAQEVDSTVEDTAVEAEIIVDEATLAEQKLEKLNALTDEDMPDIETLNEDSDFSGFMSTGVSEALRKMALQKLFHGKTYNIRDGLDEYDGDYTSFEKLDPSVITCDMKHILEVEAEKLLAEEKAKEEELLQADLDKELDKEIEEDAAKTELAEQESNDEENKKIAGEIDGEENQDEIESMIEDVVELDESDLDEMDDVEGEDV